MSGPRVTSRQAVPHCRELLADTLTPLAAYRRLAPHGAVRFLFESVTGGERISRYSFLGAGAREIVRLYPDRLERERGYDREALPGPPLTALAALLGEVAAGPGPAPFTGGWVGFFGYDVVRLLERLPGRPPDPFGLPLALLARFDNLVVFDHARQRLLLIANEIEGEVDAAAAEQALDRLARHLEGPAEGEGRGAVRLPERFPAPPPLQPAFKGEAFQAAVRTAQEQIAAGEIFQVVLARRFRLPSDVQPLPLYWARRLVDPSPYMVLFECPDLALVGASPEMLVRKEGDRIVTRPIAGTRPRAADREGDARLAAELLADPKERAEHLMLVDLGRNDLGRVAAPGSVEVTSYAQVERYARVMHLVSNVEARLAPGRTALAALLSCFPAGTVSGAPKIRAMEIIDELEPEARGPYAGAVGYLSFTGDLDTCITIRTLVVRGGETSVSAGAGIVADSRPEDEQRETENKAAALLQAVALARELQERS
ncbi:MAG: chorismate-binding protein [Acidobacteriota bacterium]|nr:chorismate-binding protein [Acidobacteriota bacterium]